MDNKTMVRISISGIKGGKGFRALLNNNDVDLVDTLIGIMNEKFDLNLYFEDLGESNEIVDLTN